MTVQEKAKAVAVVVLALTVLGTAFFIVSSILMTLAVVIPVIIVVAVIAAVLSGDRKAPRPHIDR